jgi:hypothetical protein
MLNGCPRFVGPDDVTISITVDARTASYLRALTRSVPVPHGTLEDVVSYLVHSAADGLRRPGAWERGWLEQAFGEWPDGPQTEGVPYSHLEPWTADHIDLVDADYNTDDACGACGASPCTNVRLTDGTWDCLGCVCQYEHDDERALEPAELAAASLLAFVQRAGTERGDRPRCCDCGRGKGGHLVEQVVDGEPWLVCAECLAEHERDFQRCAHCPGTLVFCDVTPDGRVDVAGRLKCNECGTVRVAP